MEYIDFGRTISISGVLLTSSDLITAAENTNLYIRKLIEMFTDIGFDLFDSLGQRNISGFIGEIFKNILSNNHPSLNPNPHPDGYPDILVLDKPEIINHYKDCFSTIHGRNVPIKNMFTPFKFDGLEVKCTIGSSGNDNTYKYIENHGHSYSIYKPRVGYLNGITWWAHHNGSNSLLGLYYDYYAPFDGAPQILAAFYSELTRGDWNAVSTGDPNHKKTSNTSLNSKGRKKMMNNCLFSVLDDDYLNQLRLIGVDID